MVICLKWNGSHAATLRKRLAAKFQGWKLDDSIFERQFDSVVDALRVGPGQGHPALRPT